jgi:hypothetical protein
MPRPRPHGVGVGLLGAQRQGGQDVRAQVHGEDLDHRQRQGHPEQDERHGLEPAPAELAAQARFHFGHSGVAGPSVVTTLDKACHPEKTEEAKQATEARQARQAEQTLVARNEPEEP